MVLVIVFYLLYRSSPDNTERALLDVLNEKCGKSPSETKTCIQRLLSSKTSCKVPEDVPKTKQVTPDCSHLESEYKNLEHTVHDLNKWTEGIESVFKDPSQMSEPLRTLKDHHRHLQTMSSAGKGNDLADVTQVEADVKTIAEANEAISKTLHETNTNLAEVRSTLAETRTNLTETNTKVGKQEGRINQQDEKQRNVTENVIPDIRSKMGQIQGKADEAKWATDTNGGKLINHINWANSAYEEFKEHREQLTNSGNRLDSTVSKLSAQMESLTNRFENIDVWKTEIETLEPSKIRQDAKDATRGVEGCLKKVDTLMQDVGSISINVTSVNTTVSELAHIVTAVVTRLAELDARERRIADTGDATRKMAEDAEKAAAENARCVQELSFEVKSITTKMAGINSTMSTMYQAMNESTALLMSWKTEISEKELPMIKQNITDDRKLLEEARQNASESSGLLQGHILWAIHTSLDFKKRINEILKREEEFKDEHDSVKREVETLKNVSKVLGFDVANLQENVSSLQHLAESVRTQVFSNVDKLEAVTQSVGNITSNITAINITSEDLSSQLSATKQSVKSLASWRNELVLTELPTLKQYIDVVHQEVEQVQRNTSTNGDLIKAHIVWANWTYVEFQKHRNATNKKVAEFAGKHDTTDRKLDGEELDGAMTKAELSQLKGKSTFHAEVRSTLAETRTNLTETNPKFGKLEDRINKLKETQNNLMEIVIPGIESKVGDIRGKAIEAKEATEENGGRLKEYFKQSNSAYEEFKKHRDATNRKVAEFAGKHVAAERKLDGEELDGAMTKAELSQLKGKSTLHDIALYLTLLNIIAVVIVAMYVRQTLSSASAPVSTPAVSPAAFHNNTQRGFQREEVYELSWTGPMEDTLCVVTFHTETELKHADQTRSVFESVQQPCPTIHTRVIRCHADIKQLPGSRVFLVFVDFNERNVILEDPTKWLGDLRVTTVRSLWGFGADVTVIYCGDRGSVNLGSGLFNPDLGSIHRQKELTQLKKSDRILSICNDFSIDQKEHCRNFINRLLKRQQTTSADYDFNNHG